MLVFEYRPKDTLKWVNTSRQQRFFQRVTEHEIAEPCPFDNEQMKQFTSVDFIGSRDLIWIRHLPAGWRSSSPGLVE